MKKAAVSYSIIWAVLVALFNVIAFVSVGWEGYEVYTPSFWTGYIFIMISFVGQLICAWIGTSGKSAQKLFYNFSMLKISFTALIISFIVGGLCMLISPLPYWIAILVCSVIFAIQIIAVIKAKTVADIVSDMDDNIKTKTFFVKSLTADAETLVTSAKSDVIKAECKKVYEAFRYSDPMGNDALAHLESQITDKFAEFSEVVKADDSAKAVEIANEVLALLGDRNRKCRLLK